MSKHCKPAHDNRCDVNHPHQGRDHDHGHHNPACNPTTTTTLPPSTTTTVKPTTSTTVGRATTTTFHEGPIVPPTHHGTTTTIVQVGTAAQLHAEVAVAKPVGSLPNTGSSTMPLVGVGSILLMAGLAARVIASKVAH